MKSIITAFEVYIPRSLPDPTRPDRFIEALPDFS